MDPADDGLDDASWLKREIMKICARQFGMDLLEPQDASKPFEDYDCKAFDSLALMELALSLEAHFHVQLDEMSLMHNGQLPSNIDELAACISPLLKARRPLAPGLSAS
jgi:acyl carrier protein